MFFILFSLTHLHILTYTYSIRSWSPEGSCIVTSNGENGGLPTAPVVSRDGWSADVSLIGHQAPIEVAVNWNQISSFSLYIFNFLLSPFSLFPPQAFNPVLFKVKVPGSPSSSSSSPSRSSPPQLKTTGIS